MSQHIYPTLSNEKRADWANSLSVQGPVLVPIDQSGFDKTIEVWLVQMLSSYPMELLGYQPSESWEWLVKQKIYVGTSGGYITQGLMSGVKTTSIVGSMANYIYHFATNGGVRPGDMFAGDDGHTSHPTLISAVQYIDRFADEGLNVSQQKNRLSCTPYRMTDFLQVQYSPDIGFQCGKSGRMFTTMLYKKPWLPATRWDGGKEDYGQYADWQQLQRRMPQQVLTRVVMLLIRKMQANDASYNDIVGAMCAVGYRNGLSEPRLRLTDDIYETKWQSKRQDVYTAKNAVAIAKLTITQAHIDVMMRGIDNRPFIANLASSASVDVEASFRYDLKRRSANGRRIIAAAEAPNLFRKLLSRLVTTP